MSQAWVKLDLCIMTSLVTSPAGRSTELYILDCNDKFPNMYSSSSKARGVIAWLSQARLLTADFVLRTTLNFYTSPKYNKSNVVKINHKSYFVTSK